MAPRKVDKQARRQEILRAAAGVFAQHGFRQATIHQVAAAAGIAKGSVYLYFGSKEELFHALFEQLTEQSLAEVACGPSTDDRIVARIEALFRSLLSNLDANESMIPLTLEFWSACGLHETRERFGTRYAQMFEQFRAVLTGLIESGIERGELAAELPARALASSLMAMIDGLLLQQWTDPSIRASATLDAALPILLQSLRSPTAP